MLTGHLDKVEREFVAGWAANTDAADAVQDVQLYVNGERWATIRCDRLRRDLQEMGDLGDGRHGFRYDFDPPLPLEMDVRISVRFAANGELLPRGEQTLAAARATRPLAPILVTAPGRSGTTLLMSRLIESNQIVAAGIPPFEIRLLTYYATAFHVLTAPADFVRSMHPDYLEGTGYQVGFNPFSHASYLPAFTEPNRVAELFRSYAGHELLPAFRRIITEYYARLRDDQSKPAARFFAEKTNNLARLSRDFPRQLFGSVKEIVLIRDPRDLCCSHAAYFHADRDAARRAVIGSSAALEQIASEAGEDIIFIRYHDLLMGDGATMRRLSEFLGVEVSPHAADDQERAIFARHATSASPEATVDRWRQELDAETIEVIELHCGELLRRFGYDTGDSTEDSNNAVS